MKKFFLILIISIFMNRCIWFNYPNGLFGIFQFNENIEYTKDIKEIEVKTHADITDPEHDWFISKSKSETVIVIGKDKITGALFIKVSPDPTEAIPETYGDLIKIKDKGTALRQGISLDTPIKTWALFLIPNDAIYLDNDKLMHQLWTKFQNLGNEISDLDCSIWFIRQNCQNKSTKPWRCYDSERSQKYINKLIKTSKYAPYILILPKHPDRIDPKKDKDIVNVLCFKDMKISEFQKMIDKLIRAIKNRKLSRFQIWKIEKESWVPSNLERYVRIFETPIKEILKYLK